MLGDIHGLVDVPTKHHPTTWDISSPTDICSGDVKPIPKKVDLPTTDIYQPIIPSPVHTKHPSRNHVFLSGISTFHWDHLGGV